MGFGRGGILGSPRRGSIVDPLTSTSGPLRLAEFGSLAENGFSYVSIVVPENTPPMRRPDPWDDLGHNQPDGLINALAGDPENTERSLISDARDLLVETLFKISNEVSEPPYVYPWIDAQRRETEAERWREERRASWRLGVTPVEMFWDSTPSPFFVGPDGVPIQAGRKFIHLGANGTTERLLDQLRVERQFDRSAHWNGNLNTLDADGFVAISLQENHDRHLILAGGSDYGTYFAVAWFLQWGLRPEHCVRWLFPGDLGTIIPRTGLAEAGIVNRIDEPDYRGRCFAVMVSGALQADHSAYEMNETRNWLLRNRVRPSLERTGIFYNGRASSTTGSARRPRPRLQPPSCVRTSSMLAASSFAPKNASRPGIT